MTTRSTMVDAASLRAAASRRRRLPARPAPMANLYMTSRGPMPSPSPIRRAAGWVRAVLVSLAF